MGRYKLVPEVGFLIKHREQRTHVTPYQLCHSFNSSFVPTIYRRTDLGFGREELSDEEPDQLLERHGRREHMGGRGDAASRGKSRVSPDIYEGRGSLEEYLTHFEMVAEINGWNEDDMARYLAVSLRGEALQAVRCLPADVRRDYDLLKGALLKRFAPSNRSEIHRTQLGARRRKEGETLPKLAYNIRHLVASAYPELDGMGEMFERLCKSHFLDALDSSEMRSSIYYRHPRTLDEALTAALEMEAFQEAEGLRSGVSSKPSLDKRYVREILPGAKDAPAGVQQQMEELRKQLEQMKMRLDGGCRRCGKPDHKAFQCPSVVCFQCKRTGHIAKDCPDRGSHPNAGRGQQRYGSSN